MEASISESPVYCAYQAVIERFPNLSDLEEDYGLELLASEINQQRNPMDLESEKDFMEMIKSLIGIKKYCQIEIMLLSFENTH